MSHDIRFLSQSLELPAHLTAAIAEISENKVANGSGHSISRESDNSGVEGETEEGLLYTQKGLSYVDAQLGELYLDFVGDHINYSRKAHRGKSELIAKAIGMAKGYKQVFDATMGLAQDAFFLSQIGAVVEGCERSPEVFLLLRDAIFRSGIDNLKVRYGDAQAVLQSIEGPSVIYLDPMFPHKKKSALPRKEMQIFRKLVGDDLDGVDLLNLARRKAKDRIVVKRPLKSEELASGVIHKFEGTTVRYDLYSPTVENT